MKKLLFLALICAILCSCGNQSGQRVTTSVTMRKAIVREVVRTSSGSFVALDSSVQMLRIDTMYHAGDIITNTEGAYLILR